MKEEIQDESLWNHLDEENDFVWRETFEGARHS